MKTIEPKSLISRPAYASGRCGCSSPRLTPNDSCAYMDSFGIFFTWGVTCCGLLTTVCYEPAPSWCGTT